MKVISVSRRTDIPAFYSRWFMNRLHAGFAMVPNPFNPRQISTVALVPHSVACLVFVTKNPAPLLRHLEELDRKGYRYYFQVTVTGLPTLFEPGVPDADAIAGAMTELAARIGKERVVWRFDPILFSDLSTPEIIIGNFDRLASGLRGSVERVIISFAREYRQVRGRLKRLERQGRPLPGVRFVSGDEIAGRMGQFLASIAEIAGRNGMSVFSCAEQADLLPFGIEKGNCIDGLHIRSLFGINVPLRKDPGQRSACGCIRSVDIGMYGSCPHGCLYCYACADSELSRSARHDPESPMLLGHPPPSEPSLFQ